MLKTIEEPPPRTIMLLVTSAEHVISPDSSLRTGLLQLELLETLQGVQTPLAGLPHAARTGSSRILRSRSMIWRSVASDTRRHHAPGRR